MEMFVRLASFIVLAHWLMAGMMEAAPAPEDVQKAQKAVDEKIKEMKGESVLPSRFITSEALAKVLPDHLFFEAHASMYPVGRSLPQGAKVKTHNLFAFAKDGKITHLSEAKELEKFFKDNLPAAKDEAPLKQAAHAWMTLAPEFIQDGYFKFKIVEDATKVADGKNGKQVTGKVVVMAGGNGEIDSTLTFDAAGKPVSASDAVKVRAGVRPICQATKLLDSDRIVRAMAERDLLIMGRAARAYLLEQRAKATPELQKAIDGIWERIISEDR
jgi:hypothetical protein